MRVFLERILTFHPPFIFYNHESNNQYITIVMQKMTFNHRQMREIKVLETGLICVHYTHDQHGVDVHVFDDWKDFYDSHPNLLYLHNVAWSKIKAFLQSINIFTKRP